jgi:N-acyl-D-amino-acid deacylase
LNMNSQFASLMSGDLGTRRQAYADDAWRRRTEQVWAEGIAFSTPRWHTYEIDESPSHPELVGERLATLAAARGQAPFDTLLDLTLDEPDLALRVRCVLANDDEAEVAKLLLEDHCTLGLSDAGAHVGQLCDAPQATDFLGNWVRDRGLMALEPAVRKLTKVQADLFGIPDRGVLAPGAWADVVVFDPDTVSPGPLRRLRDFPADAERLTADQPTGVRHILVNGTPTQLDGVRLPDAVGAGQVVRPAPRPA